MERILIEGGLNVSLPVRAKLDYFALLTGKQIKVTTNPNAHYNSRQILIIVDAAYTLEGALWDEEDDIALLQDKLSLGELSEDSLEKAINLYERYRTISKKELEEMKKREEEAFKKTLVLQLRKAVDYKIEDIKEGVELKKMEISLCEATIIKAVSFLRRAKESLEKTEELKNRINEESSSVERAIAEILALKKNGIYKEIEFKFNEIVALTPMIYCEHSKNRYELGKYEVHVPLSNTEIRIYNLTRKVNGYQHPHIRADGQCCLGNLQKVIPKHLGRADFAIVLTALNAYLRNYNQDSPYHKIENWPKIKRRRKR